MVVKSATKKWLMDGGMPELYAHVLAEDRTPYYDVFLGDKRQINKALIRMNYEEIADCLLENPIFPVHSSSEFYSDLGEILQGVKKYWLQRMGKRYEEFGNMDDNVYLYLLEDWDIEYESWKFIKWDFLNWNKNPFQTK